MPSYKMNKFYFYTQSDMCGYDVSFLFWMFKLNALVVADLWYMNKKKVSNLIYVICKLILNMKYVD